MAGLDPQLQALIDNQAITSNWPADYPYHPLNDANGNPAVIQVANEYLSAWLTRDDAGNFTEVTVLSEEQLSRIYDQRPSADLPNRVIERDGAVWVDGDNPSQSWSGDDYEEVVYNTQTGELSDVAAMFEGNAAWLADGQQGQRPFNKVVLPSGLAADGVSTEDLEQRLPVSVVLQENTRRLEQTVDSSVKARAEVVLGQAQGLATAQVERVRMGGSDPSIVYSDAQYANEFGLQYEEGLQITSFEPIDPARMEQLWAESFEDDGRVQPGIAPGAMAEIIAGIEQDRANAAANPVTGAGKIGIQEPRTGHGNIRTSDIPEIGEPPMQPLITLAQRQSYVEGVLGAYEDHITSSDPNRADGFGEMGEALAGLREQLPNVIDPERLKAQIEIQLTPDQLNELEQNGGIESAVAAIQKEIVNMSASGALNPDLNVAAQDAVNEARAQLPSMIDDALNASLEQANQGMVDAFDRANAQRDVALDVIAQQTPENIDNQTVQALVETFRAYQQSPAWEQIKETYAAQNDPNATRALEILEQEQAGNQPALQGLGTNN